MGGKQYLEPSIPIPYSYSGVATSYLVAAWRVNNSIHAGRSFQHHSANNAYAQTAVSRILDRHAAFVLRYAYIMPDYSSESVRMWTCPPIFLRLRQWIWQETDGCISNPSLPCSLRAAMWSHHTSLRVGERTAVYIPLDTYEKSQTAIFQISKCPAICWRRYSDRIPGCISERNQKYTCQHLLVFHAAQKPSCSGRSVSEFLTLRNNRIGEWWAHTCFECGDSIA
jgi:hypothetical protein